MNFRPVTACVVLCFLGGLSSHASSPESSHKASNKKEVLFSSLTDEGTTLNALKAPYTKALLTDEDCSNCTALLRRLKKCKSFDTKNFAVFATGKIKPTKRKMKHLIRKKVHVYHNHTMDSLVELGASALPTYINKDKEFFVGLRAVHKALLKEKVCVL